MPSLCEIVGSASAVSTVRPLQPSQTPPEDASASRNATASPPAAARLPAATRFETTTRRPVPVMALVLPHGCRRRPAASCVQPIQPNGVLRGPVWPANQARNDHLELLVPGPSRGPASPGGPVPPPAGPAQKLVRRP